MWGCGRCVSYMPALSSVIMLMLLCVTGCLEKCSGAQRSDSGGGAGVAALQYIELKEPKKSK